MDNQIFKLSEISKKNKRLILGLMSGTSLDGLDIALCAIKGHGRETAIEILNFTTKNFSEIFKKDIKTVFAQPKIDFEKLCLLHEHIGNTHAQLILEALADWDINPKNVDAIASHGQTVFHAPIHQHKKKGYPNATLQIGDADHIAVKTGIITLADFRQKHLAAGGEGAPLALYGDMILFSHPTENRILLNIGGIANFTFLPALDSKAKIFSTDVGPGNTLADQFVQQHYTGLFFDENADIAQQGTTSQPLLKALLEHAFFSTSFPKTTGPELFNMEYISNCQNISNTQRLSNADVLCTLFDFTAHAIKLAVEKIHIPENATVYLSGGGMHNPLLVKQLKAIMPKLHFSTTQSLGILPDAKEAVLFAVLANETLSGSTINFGNAGPSVCMGKISLPH